MLNILWTSGKPFFRPDGIDVPSVLSCKKVYLLWSFVHVRRDYSLAASLLIRVVLYLSPPPRRRETFERITAEARIKHPALEGEKNYIKK